MISTTLDERKPTRTVVMIDQGGCPKVDLDLDCKNCIKAEDDILLLGFSYIVACQTRTQSFSLRGRGNTARNVKYIKFTFVLIRIT